MKKIIKSIFALSLLSGMLASSAFAATATTPLDVTATLNPSCTISSTPVAFGAVSSTSGDVTANGSVSVLCNKGTSYVLLTSVGTGASFANRSMGGTAGNTDRLAYNIYTDSIFSTPLSDNGQGALGGGGLGALQTRTIYGKLPGGQFVKADSYLDTLTITLNY